MDFLGMVNRQLMLFSLLALGVLLTKIGLMDKQSRSFISGLVINVLMPCSILASFFQASNEGEFLKSFFIVLAAGLVIHLFTFLLSKFLYRKLKGGVKAVLMFATMTSNAAFVGIPVIDGIFGPEGVMLTSAYFLAMNTFMWTIGIAQFEGPSKKKGRDKVFTVIKQVVLQPNILVLFIGLALLLTGFRFPAFISDTIVSVGQCTTVFALLAVGQVMANVDLKTMFTKQNWFYCLIQLIVIPAVTLAVLLPFNLGKLVTGLLVILSGMPAASSTAMVADRYNQEPELASKLVSLSTLVSMLTIPVMALLVNKFA